MDAATMDAAYRADADAASADAASIRQSLGRYTRDAKDHRCSNGNNASI